jgi:hypothetical protein
MVFGKKKDDDVVGGPKTLGRVEGRRVFEYTSQAHDGEPFSTTNKKTCDRHLEEIGHYRKGVAPCAICGLWR